MATPFSAAGGLPGGGSPGFSGFLRSKGFENGSLIDILPRLDLVQQVQLDRKLNLKAADPNDKRYPHYRGYLINDANWKQKLIDVFSGKENNSRLIRELIAVVARGIKSHERQAGDQLGGSSKWNATWIKVYERWLHELKKLLSQEGDV